MFFKNSLFLALHFLYRPLSYSPDVLEVSLLPDCLVPKQLGMDQTLPRKFVHVLLYFILSLNGGSKLKLVIGPSSRLVLSHLLIPGRRLETLQPSLDKGQDSSYIKIT